MIKFFCSNFLQASIVRWHLSSNEIFRNSTHAQYTLEFLNLANWFSTSLIFEGQLAWCKIPGSFLFKLLKIVAPLPPYFVHFLSKISVFVCLFFKLFDLIIWKPERFFFQSFNSCISICFIIDYSGQEYQVPVSFINVLLFSPD